MLEALHREDAVLILIDWQTRLFEAMDPVFRERHLRAAGTLRWMAGELGIPVLCSEQYPRGLGHTLEALEIEEAVEKISFSAMAEPSFADRLSRQGRGQVILSGMETHICVAQTGRDLLRGGRKVWAVADACLSRRSLDWRLGLQRMQSEGAQITSSEALLFELLGTAASPLFKELSRRIR